MKAKKGLVISSFKLEKRKDKNTGVVKTDNVPILADFKFDGQRVIYPIGYRIDFAKWNDTEQRVKRNNFNKDGIGANIINKRIETIASQLPIIYNDALGLNKPITSKLLLDHLNSFLLLAENTQIKAANTPQQKSVIDYLPIFIADETKNKDWSANTRKKFATFTKLLGAYSPKLKFEDITDDFLTNLKKYFSEQLDFNNSTNYKYMVLFHWFLNWCTQKGYNTNLSYKNLKLKYAGLGDDIKQKNLIFLTWDELQNLNNLDLSNKKRLEQIRDIYCFCCFTSLRYSDIKNLKKNDIKTDNNNNLYLEILTLKTIQAARIELNKYALAIWNKYKDQELINNCLFPVPTNQKLNQYLKEVAKLAGLKSKETYVKFIGEERIDKHFEKWELITCHTARKTFITNAMYLGIAPEIIMKWTGHKDHKSMKPYLKIVDEQKRTSMDKFNSI